MLMSFLETVELARAFLERNGRVSLRRTEAASSGSTTMPLDELSRGADVDVQQVAGREGNDLSRAVSEVSLETSAAETQAPARPTALRHRPHRPPRRQRPRLLRRRYQQAPTFEGERRQLTVLFCDLVDSVKLAAGLDPEDWREVVHEPIRRRPARRSSDWPSHVAPVSRATDLLVYFGYPQAMHEDDAIRRPCKRSAGDSGRFAAAECPDTGATPSRWAVRAYGVRIGVHTGPRRRGQGWDAEPATSSPPSTTGSLKVWARRT